MIPATLPRIRTLLIAAALGAALLGIAKAAERPRDASPVKLTLTAVADQTQARLTLEIKIEPTWYIYVKSSRSQVLKIDLELPAGVTTSGEWTLPKPRVVYQDEKVEIYSGEQRLERSLKVDPTVTDEVTIGATVLYQACDPKICRPPETVRVFAKLKTR